MVRHARLPFLLFLQHLVCNASPLRRAPASSILQDLSNTVVTKTVVTTITTQTQETKTVVTKEKPAEESEVSRFDNDSNVRLPVLPVSEGSTSVAEVMASMRRAAPREEVETIQFPAAASAYIRKDTHGDGGMLEDNMTDQSQPEHVAHAPDMGLLDVQEKHNLREKHQAQHFAKGNTEEASERKQEERVTDVAENADLQNSRDIQMSRWQSLLSTSEGSGNGMLPAACRLLFFLVGVIIVLLAACGCASAALLI